MRLHFHATSVVDKFQNFIFRKKKKHMKREIQSNGEMMSKEGKECIQERNIVGVQKKEKERDLTILCGMEETEYCE